MSVFKIHKSANFSIIKNSVINDEKLSWKARGVLIYLLSKPEHWTVSVADIISKSEHDGHSSVQSALKELRLANYIKLNRGEFKDKNGKKQFGSFYDVYEEPQQPQ